MDAYYLHPRRDTKHAVSHITHSITKAHPYALFTSALAYSIWTVDTVAVNTAIVPPHFISYCSDILSATNLSTSVILLGLYYVFRLRHSVRFNVRESEFYMVVLGLVLANKFLEDATYTNKTWADVSRLDLRHLNALERYALGALNYELNVSPSTYRSWLSLITYAELPISPVDEYELPFVPAVPQNSFPLKPNHVVSPPLSPQTVYPENQYFSQYTRPSHNNIYFYDPHLYLAHHPIY
jgi:hypothetical protein